MIFFVSHVFRVNKFNEIEISSVTRTDCCARCWLWNRNGQYGSQATLTNKVSGARDKANLNFIELVYLKNVGNK